MSRADELRRWSIRWDLERELPEPILFEAPNGIICDAPQAVEFIHDLESTLARRDAKIAELERGLLDGMVAALQDSEEERTRIAAAQAEVIQRDERIAELVATLVRVREEISGFRGQFQVSVAETQDALVKSLVPVLSAARAEVPEWCREIIRLEREAYEKHHSGDAVAILCRLRILVKSLTHDQLRACGIEP
jgi:hypothetical protein